MELTLRRAATADLEWIATFRRDLYAHDPESINEERDAETLLHLINKPDLGWALLIEVAGRFALIDELYVTPDRRGGGIGSQVLKQIEQHARGAGIRAIRLEVERMNLGAWRLYRKHGFEAHDRRLMTKWLPADDDVVTS